MQKIENVDALQVGKYYLVPVAILKYPNGVIDEVPIINILHKDKQFGKVGSEPHYHIDGRFRIKGYGNYNLINGHTNVVIGPSHSIYNSYILQRVEVKKKKCIRILTGLQIANRVTPPKTWAKWSDTMVGKSCKGKKCPHFGAKMIETDGKYICPLHNLVGDIATQKIIKSY